MRSSPPPAPPFVSRFDIYLFRGGAFSFLMANAWYAAWLGSDGQGGNRPRLRRELNRLKAMGVRCVRLLAGSEGCTNANSSICSWTMQPAMQTAPGQYDHHLLVGLDLALLEIERRGMVAVLVLNTMAPGHGGFAQYVEWAGGREARAAAPESLWDGVSWNRLRWFSRAARFYTMPQAVGLSHNHIRFLLSRRNSFTGRLYKQDPTIMSYELASAPRSMGRRDAYRAWVQSTAALLKRLAPNHLVTIGSEGAHAALAEEWIGELAPQHGWQPDMSDFEADHRIVGIDYTTCQLWLEPWGWYEQQAGDKGLEVGIDRAKQYLHAHLQTSARLGKPLVIDEAGLARDGMRSAQAFGVSRRNQLLKSVLDIVQHSIDHRDALAGVGFGWTGEARPKWRPAAPIAVWQAGDPLLADSPTEHQGRSGVYDKDNTTIALLTSYGVHWEPVSSLHVQQCSGGRDKCST